MRVFYGVGFWSCEQKESRSAGEILLRRSSSPVKGLLCEKFAWNAGAGNKLAHSWTLCQFSRAFRSDMFYRTQEKVQTMDQVANWMQNNWYEFGTLVGQFTLLFAGLWFAGKILSTMRATQQQMGALLRLSMTGGLDEHSKMEERPPISEANHEPAPSVVASSMFSPAMERPTSYSAFEKSARTETPSLSELSGRAKTSAPIASTLVADAPMASTQDPTPYVAAPLTMPEGEHNGGHLASAVQWLQTPMANKKKGASPLTKVVRWLQAPAR